jgi:hypothetical protein
VSSLVTGPKGFALGGADLAEAAVEVLRDADGPLHYNDILGELTVRGVLVGGERPANTLLAVLGREERVESVRARSGTYRLLAQ